MCTCSAGKLINKGQLTAQNLRTSAVIVVSDVVVHYGKIWCLPFCFVLVLHLGSTKV